MSYFIENFKLPYEVNERYKKSIVYFSMEFAIDQSLKIYSGGLGFLAGSHMRSAYELKQNIFGIGILWKYGYYDQIRQADQSMEVLFQEKKYHFLEETDIKFSIKINGHEVWLKVFYLAPQVFGSAPLFLLSTDVAENDFLGRTTTDKLYDSDPQAKIAQCMVLGLGGSKLLDYLGIEPNCYHLNEAHALSSVFHLYKKWNNLEELKQKVVFTTHTPEEAGNEKHDFGMLYDLGFFNGLSIEEARKITMIEGEVFNHSLAALRLCKKANGVSKIHGEVAREMWKEHEEICEIGHITNAQNKKYWKDYLLEEAREKNDVDYIVSRKRRMKTKLFEIVADQTGKIFDKKILTIVWARRFADYKRADLIIRDLDDFRKLMTDQELPVQIIWAGKPYPMDYNARHVFNHLVHLSKEYKNMAILVGYELKLSKMLKDGSDVWLNTPRITREASGTSGMTAAMNGSLNLSTYDGWVCEFLKHGHNGYIIPPVDNNLPNPIQDREDRLSIYKILREEILPLYYNNKKKWIELVLNSMNEVVPYFDSNRMADEYYEKLYF